ncbi:T9SS type A sorting domain-containing protein [Flavobacterium caeni]|uniref:Por secretion system C-terminal sorting domain-containing protein n=1 Tax=Flavobacterium caeni TaxID=490189 RepID=A0A1G5D0W8_9FLAO|nr:T9SS type A sorting domain-containing protein [Flavobacterium caeni]SCY08296.1 Por secretion system C-terminal sorting domain-containing protein [Flavobacterium caeni]
MKKITLLLFLVTSMAHAQQIEWIKNPPIDFNSNGDLIGYTTTADPSGNVYLAGFKENMFYYSEIHGDIYYNKYDNTGALLFSKTFTGHVTVNDMTADSQGNVYLAATFVNLMQVGELLLSTEEQGTQNALFKFNPQGELVWHMQFEMQQWSEPTIFQIVTDAQDNLYVGYCDFMDSIIQKFTPDGAPMLTITQQNVRMLSSISVDNQGNIYAAGSCTDPGATFNGVDIEDPLTYNTFLVKYSPAGVYQWVRFQEDITCPKPQVVAVSPDEVYFSSYLFDDYLFDDIATEGPLGMFNDFFLTRLNANGEYQWVQEVPGQGMAQIGNHRYLSADPQGNILFVGSTRGGIQWTDTVSTASNGPSEDGLVLQYDKNGNLLMAKTVGGASNDRIDAVSVTPSGAIAVVGVARGSATIDGFSFEADEFDYWPFLAQLTNDALGTVAPVEPVIGFYPNPASDKVFPVGISKAVTGSLYNMLGQKVLDFSADAQHPIEVSSLAKGTYLIKADGFRVAKLIKK